MDPEIGNGVIRAEPPYQRRRRQDRVMMTAGRVTPDLDVDHALDQVHETDDLVAVARQLTVSGVVAAGLPRR
jgi:hypothetical protein